MRPVPSPASGNAATVALARADWPTVYDAIASGENPLHTTRIADALTADSCGRGCVGQDRASVRCSPHV
jgi:hypothetical protein